jgi:adenine deaminase
MGNISKINFVKDHQPGNNDVIELKNARFVDVINGCFFDKDISLFIKSGKIISMPALKHESSDIKPAFSIDLQGKTVLPGFFNVHCHIQMVNPTLFANFKTVKDKKKYGRLPGKRHHQYPGCLFR